MGDNIAKVHTGRLSLARISYYTKLQSADGLIVPLGVIAEIAIESWRGLGLIARTSLSTVELDEIAPVLRPKIASGYYIPHEGLIGVMGAGPAGGHLQGDRRQEEPRLQGDPCLDGHHRQVLGRNAAEPVTVTAPKRISKKRDFVLLAKLQDAGFAIMDLF
jgi:hypothetical protein